MTVDPPISWSALMLFLIFLRGLSPAAKIMVWTCFPSLAYLAKAPPAPVIMSSACAAIAIIVSTGLFSNRRLLNVVPTYKCSRSRLVFARWHSLQSDRKFCLLKGSIPSRTGMIWSTSSCDRRLRVLQIPHR